MSEPMMNPEPEDTDHPEEIICIEYSGDHPHSVLTDCHWHHDTKPWFKAGRDRPEGHSHHHFDFDWHNGGSTLYFRMSGSGPTSPINVGLAAEPDPPPFKIWVKDGLALTQSVEVDGQWVDQPLPREGLLARGFVLLAEPLDLGGGERNPFADGVEGETVYCEKCDDWLPTSWDDPCEHITWCDDCEEYVYETVCHVGIGNSGDDKPVIHEGVKCE